MHQHPPHTPLLDSTRAAKSSQVSGVSIRVVSVMPVSKPRPDGGGVIRHGAPSAPDDRLDSTDSMGAPCRSDVQAGSWSWLCSRPSVVSPRSDSTLEGRIGPAAGWTHRLQVLAEVYGDRRGSLEVDIEFWRSWYWDPYE